MNEGEKVKRRMAVRDRLMRDLWELILGQEMRSLVGEGFTGGRRRGIYGGVLADLEGNERSFC